MGYGSSDPEGEFLKTLTRREKKLLLRKLEALDQEGGPSSQEGLRGIMNNSANKSDKKRKRTKENEEDKIADKSKVSSSKHDQQKKRGKQSNHKLFHVLILLYLT
jgi:hypothetical protein